MPPKKGKPKGAMKAVAMKGKAPCKASGGKKTAVKKDVGISCLLRPRKADSITMRLTKNTLRKLSSDDLALLVKNIERICGGTSDSAIPLGSLFTGSNVSTLFGASLCETLKVGRVSDKVNCEIVQAFVFSNRSTVFHVFPEAKHYRDLHQASVLK